MRPSLHLSLSSLPFLAGNPLHADCVQLPVPHRVPPPPPTHLHLDKHTRGGGVLDETLLAPVSLLSPFPCRQSATCRLCAVASPPPSAPPSPHSSTSRQTHTRRWRPR